MSCTQGARGSAPAPLQWQFTGLVAVVPSTGLASSVVRDTTLEGDAVKPPHHRLTNLVTRPRSIGSPAPIHPTLPARTHPLQRELGARSHRNCESGRGVSASAKFGCRLQTQPHQPTCRLAPTLVASMAPERTPEDGSASSRSEDTHIEPPPTAKELSVNTQASDHRLRSPDRIGAPAGAHRWLCGAASPFEPPQTGQKVPTLRAARVSRRSHAAAHPSRCRSGGSCAHSLLAPRPSRDQS